MGHVLDLKKIEGLIVMNTLKNKKQGKDYLSVTSFHRKFWGKRSNMLASLAESIGNKPFDWKEKHAKAFVESKAVMAKETLLCYLNYNLPFLMFPDASER